MSFDYITIIFNPNSTGDSPDIAKDFRKKLHKQHPESEIRLKETKEAGHAIELAYEAACLKGASLIVSVSGDGGYNEVINGAMRALDEGKGNPVCAVLPGGNANDHYESVNRKPLLEALESGKVETLDLLHLSADDSRYAHSYIGLGLTPLVAVELNKHTLSAFKETWLAVKTFWGLKPFEVVVDGKKLKFDSLVCGNIDRMAKYLTLAKSSSVKDGKFEVIRWPHANKLKLILMLLKSAFGKGIPADKYETFTFTTVKTLPLQLDGEIMKIEKNVLVTIRSAYGKLRTIR